MVSLSGGEARIHKMIESRPDWCNLAPTYFGVTPLPLFVHKQTDMLHPDTVDYYAKKWQMKLNKRGMDVWFENDASYWLGDEAGQYDQAHDIMDVWFDSGSSNYAVLERPQAIAFFQRICIWKVLINIGAGFQTSLLNAVARRGEAPYKQVLTHGFVVDEKRS